MRKRKVASFGRLLSVVGVVFIFVLVGADPAAAIVVYFNDFESGDTSGWSTPTPPGPRANPIQIEMTPVGGRHFLGQFGNQQVDLTLNNLPPHTDVRVSFDLFVIRSWDGNFVGQPIGFNGPDVWDLSVAGGPTLAHTTFNNHHNAPAPNQQAYPGSYPGGAYTAQTGADETQSLGYFHPTVTTLPMDAVYKLDFTFPHSTSSLVLDFSGSNLSPLSDESWGLDNVKVEVVPEPATIVLLTSGIIGLIVARRRRAAEMRRRASLQEKPVPLVPTGWFAEMDAYGDERGDLKTEDSSTPKDERIPEEHCVNTS